MRILMKKSILDNLEIASPCNQNWHEMQGDEQIKFCTLCTKNVYNISSMSREEAERIITSSEKDKCVRLYRRADGTIKTNDCSRVLKRVKTRFTIASRLVSGFLASVIPALPLWAQVVDDKAESCKSQVQSSGVTTVEMGGVLETTGICADELTDRLKSDRRLKKSWKEEVRNARTDFEKAVIYQSIGDTDKAIKYYSRDIKQNPDHYPTFKVLSKLLSKRGKPNDLRRSAELIKKAEAMEKKGKEAAKKAGHTYSYSNKDASRSW